MENHHARICQAYKSTINEPLAIAVLHLQKRDVPKELQHENARIFLQRSATWCSRAQMMRFRPNATSAEKHRNINMYIYNIYIYICVDDQVVLHWKSRSLTCFSFGSNLLQLRSLRTAQRHLCIHNMISGSNIYKKCVNDGS